MMVKLIAHVLVHSGDDYLLIQRSEIKRGQPNVYPTYWDIPGGGVEKGELPRDGAEEHTRFKWVTMNQALEEEKLVPYLREIFERLRNDL